MLKRKIISMAIMTIAGLLYAKEPLLEDKTLTLQEAIDIALANNQKHNIAKTTVEIAKARHKQALSANYPSMDFTLSAIRKDKDPDFILKGDIELPQELSNALALATAVSDEQKAQILQAIRLGVFPKQSLPLDLDIKLMQRDIVTGTLNINYPLYTGGKISSVIKQADLAIRASNNDLKKSDDEIRFDIKNYYHSALLMQNLDKLLGDMIERMEFIRDLTQRLYTGGSMHVKKTDYLRTKLTLSMIKSNYSVVVSKEKEAKAALAYAMGVDYHSTFTLQAPKSDPAIPTHLNSLIQKAYINNPLMNNLKIAEDIYNAKIKEAKSAYLPQVALFGNTKRIQYGLINDEDKNSWMIGIGAKISLFEGFRTKNQVLEARLKKQKISAQKCQYQDALALQLKRVFFELKRSKEQIDILKKSLKTAKENRELNIRAYQEDIVETKDVLEAQIMETMTWSDYYRAEYDYAKNLAKLQQLISQKL